MSYDIGLKRKPCPTCGDVEEPHLDWNYTSNCARMWCSAGADLADFHDKPAGDCANILADAITTMERDPDRFRAMNALNGWGTFDNLLPALRELLAALRRYPTAIVKVSR